MEYQEQYDESNSDVPDGGSDSDYNSIDSGGESDDKDLKDFKAAELREMRTQQRVKVGPSAGVSKSSGGGRRQKREPKGAPKESEFDEEEVGELEDLIVRPVATLARIVMLSFAHKCESDLRSPVPQGASHHLLCADRTTFSHC